MLNKSDTPGFIEIVANRIYAFGGTLKAPSDVSFIRHIESGYVPAQGYVFRSGTSAVIMDGALAWHSAEVQSALSVLLDGVTDRFYLASRWEPDALINLPMIVKQFGVYNVYSIGELSPLDFFTEFERTVANAQLETASEKLSLNPLIPGDIIKIGDLELEVLRTSLRLLLTNWFYERKTGSLFCADSWCLLASESPNRLVARSPKPSEISPEKIETSLISKFDWLIGANCSALVSDLETLLASRDIARLCPTNGGVIEGRDAVKTVFANTIKALQELGRRSPVSALDGVDWRAIEKKIAS